MVTQDPCLFYEVDNDGRVHVWRQSLMVLNLSDHSKKEKEKVGATLGHKSL